MKNGIPILLLFLFTSCCREDNNFIALNNVNDLKHYVEVKILESEVQIGLPKLNIRFIDSARKADSNETILMLKKLHISFFTSQAELAFFNDKLTQKVPLLAQIDFNNHFLVPLYSATYENTFNSVYFQTSAWLSHRNKTMKIELRSSINRCFISKENREQQFLRWILVPRAPQGYKTIIESDF